MPHTHRERAKLQEAHDHTMLVLSGQTSQQKGSSALCLGLLERLTNLKEAPKLPKVMWDDHLKAAMIAKRLP